MPTPRQCRGGVLLFILAAVISGCAGTPAGRVCFKGDCVKVEIADSDFKRQDGLMFRVGLPDKEGMLFVFKEEGLYGFWMLHMRFPLDIIWIAQNKRIVHIEQNALPCSDPNDCKSMIPQEKAMYVLEVNSGLVDKYRLKLGDRLGIPSGY